MREQRSSAGIEVRSASVGSSRRHCAITWRASSNGTLVNRLTTSKLTKQSSSSRGICWMHSTKSAEFRTWEAVLLDSGARVLASFLAKGWVGEPIAATIGRSGVLSYGLLASHRSAGVLSGEVPDTAVDCWRCSPSLQVSSVLGALWFQSGRWGPS